MEESARLRARIKELEGVVTTLTAQLDTMQDMEAQLVQAQKREALASLAGGAVHDFNNMLHCILAYAETALHLPQNGSTVYDTLKEIKSIVVKGRDLAERFLVFGHNGTRQPIALDLGSVVGEVKRLLLYTMPRSITFATEISPDTSPVFADAGQCEQVVMNLCLNSMDAMPDGGTLIIRTENVAVDASLLAGSGPAIPAGSYVRLSVEDNGCGISRENLERIFEPFYTTKEQGEGTGLGLSVVKSIVNKHNGFIRCLSGEGRGTCFQVYFPALPESRPSAGNTTEKQAAPVDGRKRILLIDDEDAVLKVTKWFLDNSGFQVGVCRNGDEGLSHVRNNAVDLVIMDFCMPGIDGMDLFRNLRELCGGVKILVISGYPAHAGPIEELGSDNYAFLAKPFTRQELLHHVQRLLGYGHLRERCYHSEPAGSARRH